MNPRRWGKRRWLLTAMLVEIPVVFLLARIPSVDSRLDPDTGAWSLAYYDWIESWPYLVQVMFYVYAFLFTISIVVWFVQFMRGKK